MNHFFDSSSCVHYHLERGQGVTLLRQPQIFAINRFVCRSTSSSSCWWWSGWKTLATSASNFRQQQFLSWQNRERDECGKWKMQKTLCIKCKIVLNNFCYFTIIFHRFAKGSEEVCCSTERKCYKYTHCCLSVVAAAAAPPTLATRQTLLCLTASLSAAAFTL